MARIKWVIDPAHSEVQFRIRHMMIANVTGRFERFDASVETEGDDFTSADIRFTLDLDSINTNNKERDAHLKSRDFFSVTDYPQVIFTGKKLQKTGDNYKLSGILAIRDVSREVELDVEYGGSGRDPWGNTRVGFSVEGKISRKDFGLNYNEMLESGGVLIGDDVKISGQVEFVRREVPVST